VRHCRATGQEPAAELTSDGRAQAEALADVLADRGVERIVSSPWQRAVDSIAPLALRLGLTVERDERLRERTLSDGPLPDWRERLRASFDDPDLCLPGGESSRAATARAIAALDGARAHAAHATVVVTHGNLLALILRTVDPGIGFDHWQALSNPDLYRLSDGSLERLWS
jgi:2,3-bisphosphoglycerate-dependent phosphoglycerate mutase